MRSSLALSLALLTLAGCKIGGGGGSGPSRPAYGPPPPPGAAQCNASAICMRVVPVQPGPPLAGRLIVLWAPIGDDDPTFLPEIGYDAPFFGNERTAVIPYSALSVPRRMQMFPACLDHGNPQCNHMAGVATGYVFVVPNTGGPINPQSVGKSAMTATGRVMVGYGTQPIAPGGVLRAVFPNGIAGGFAPYGVNAPPGGGHEQMWLAAPGTWFDLVSCTPMNPRCDLPIPNLN